MASNVLLDDGKELTTEFVCCVAGRATICENSNAPKLLETVLVFTYLDGVARLVMKKHKNQEKQKNYVQNCIKLYHAKKPKDSQSSFYWATKYPTCATITSPFHGRRKVMTVKSWTEKYSLESC